MKKSINYFSRVLVTLLCVGVVLTSCEDEGIEQNGNENGIGQAEPKGPVTLNLDKVTASTATFSGHLNIPSANIPYSQVTIYYSDAETFNMHDAESTSVITFDENQDFTITLKNLKYGVKYRYCMVADVKQSDKVYGEIQEFTTETVTLTLLYTGSTASAAIVSGKVTGLSSEDNEYVKVGLYYSDDLENLTEYSRNKLLAEDIQDDGLVSLNLLDLILGKKYYYCTYIYCSAYSKKSEAEVFGDIKEFVVGESVNMTVQIDESSITATTARVKGKINGIPADEMDDFRFGITYCRESIDSNNRSFESIEEISEDGSFSITLSSLIHGTKYYYYPYMCQEYSTFPTCGEVQEFTTDEVTMSLSISKFAGTAVFTIKADGLSEIDRSDFYSYFFCSRDSSWLSGSYNQGVDPDQQLRHACNWDENNEVTFVNSLFTYGVKYYYLYYNPGHESERGSFVMGDDIVATCSVDESSITKNSATLTGKIDGWLSDYPVEIGIYYGNDPSVQKDFSKAKKVKINDVLSNGEFNVELTGLASSTKYYYCLYIESSSCVPCEGVFVTPSPYSSDILDLDMARAYDLSSDGSANCYIVSDKGLYKFKTVKGNSGEYLKDVSSCQVLWESYGTSTDIQPNDLIKGVCYRDEHIAFQTLDSFKEGNAVIAATDADGNILWSWHIWMTDQPQEQVYYNDAGIMMDRNLGATTTVPGSVGTLGVLYQWGRKDPFLGSSSISEYVEARSTITWPLPVHTSTSCGTVSYVIANPTTYVYNNRSYPDWQNSLSRDDSLWTTSDKAKSIYDPCPVGWRVPDGSEQGVWSRALGSSSNFTDKSLYDSTNEGINFSGKYGGASNIWYPASGCRAGYDGAFRGVGYSGDYWSASPRSYDSAYNLDFDEGLGTVRPAESEGRASGYSLRCLKESK